MVFGNGQWNRWPYFVMPKTLWNKKIQHIKLWTNTITLVCLRWYIAVESNRYMLIIRSITRLFSLYSSSVVDGLLCNFPVDIIRWMSSWFVATIWINAVKKMPMRFWGKILMYPSGPWTSILMPWWYVTVESCRYMFIIRCITRLFSLYSSSVVDGLLCNFSVDIIRWMSSWFVATIWINAVKKMPMRFWGKFWRN